MQFACLGDRMPFVFRWEGVRFFFYSNEGTPREPVHVHAERQGAEAKIWLNPQVRVAESIGFDGGCYWNW